MSFHQKNDEVAGKVGKGKWKERRLGRRNMRKGEGGKNMLGKEYGKKEGRKTKTGKKGW